MQLFHSTLAWVHARWSVLGAEFCGCHLTFIPPEIENCSNNILRIACQCLHFVLFLLLNGLLCNKLFRLLPRLRGFTGDMKFCWRDSGVYFSPFPVPFHHSRVYLHFHCEVCHLVCTLFIPHFVLHPLPVVQASMKVAHPGRDNPPSPFCTACKLDGFL